MKCRRRSEEVEAWRYQPGKPVPEWADAIDWGTFGPTPWRERLERHGERIAPISDWWLYRTERGTIYWLEHDEFHEEFENVPAEPPGAEGV